MHSNVLNNLPFRKKYELYASVSWMASSGIGLLTANIQQSVPVEPIYAMSAYAFYMGLYRLIPVIKMNRMMHKMRPRKMQFIDPKVLKKRMKENKIWLGSGFEWSKDHTQLAHEIMKRDISETKLDAGDEIGSPWIHGVGGKEAPIYLQAKHLRQHALIAGTTGSGKTRMLDLMISQAIESGEIGEGDAVVIIDPKSDFDLMQATKQSCKRAGRENDFHYFNPAFPEKSVRLNPLKTWNRSTELANRIASLIPSESGSDPFKSFSQMVLDKVVQGLISSGEEPTLLKIRRIIEGGADRLLYNVIDSHFSEHIGEDWKEELKGTIKGVTLEKQVQSLIKYYQDKSTGENPTIPQSVAIDGLSSMVMHERDHMMKMIASLLPVLNLLTSSHMGELLSPDPTKPDKRALTDVATIINKGQVVYIGLDSLSDGMTGSAVGSLFLSELTSAAGNRYNFGIDNRRVWVFVDEAAEVVNGESFIQLLNKSRGAMMSVVLCTQTLADFSAKLGNIDKARQVLANVNTLISLRVLDADTQEYIAESLAKTKVDTVQVSSNQSSDGEHPILHSSGYGERFTEEEADLFPSQLLGQLPDLHYVARLAGGRLMKGRIPILENEKAMK